MEWQVSLNFINALMTIQFIQNLTLNRFLEPSRESIFESGICVPDTCSNSELATFLGPTLTRVGIQSTHFLCQTDKAYPLHALDFFIM